MREETVKNVLASYLKEQGHKPILAKGAGPDIMYDGTALEVKGSDSDLREALNQLTKYSFTYSALEVGFPVDKINLDFLQKLRFLETSGKSWWSQQFELVIYLIAEKGSNVYVVSKFPSVEKLLDIIHQRLDQKFSVYKHLSENNEATIAQIQQDLSRLGGLLVEVLSEDVKQTGFEISLASPNRSNGQIPPPHVSQMWRLPGSGRP